MDEKSKEENEHKDIDDMIQSAVENDIEQRFVNALQDLLWELRSTFSTPFSSTPSKVNPLHIKLTPDARYVNVKLRNYSPSQQEFMKKMMDELIHHCIMYHNPSSPWASEPLHRPQAYSHRVAFHSGS